MSNLSIIWIVLLAIISLSLSANEGVSQTIYVNNEIELYKAVQKANRSISGTTIMLADGHYNITQRIHLKGSNIQLKSSSGDPASVVLSGQGMKKSKAVEILIDVSGSNITISGVTLEKSSNHLIQIRAEHNADDFSLSNCILRDSYEQLLKVSAVHKKEAEYADNGVIQNCVFEYTEGIGPQFYIGGIDAHRSRNWKIDGNTFKNIASPSLHVAEHAIHFWRNSANITVINNIVEDCDRGIGFGLSDDPNKRTDGGLIENNIIKSSNLKHPYADAGIIIEASPNVQIINNIIWILGDYPNAIEYRFSASKNIQIKDNKSNKSIVSRDGGKAELSGNTKANVFSQLKHNIEYLINRP